MQSLPYRAGVEFQFEPERLQAVVEALEKGDISECKAPSVIHAAKVLRAVLLVHSMRPDFWPEFFNGAIPSMLVANFEEASAQQAQQAADAMGWGEALAKVNEAHHQPQKKGLVEAMVNIAILSTGGNEAKAMEMVAEYLERDIDSIRRTVSRAKGRKK
jgi:hypothetical protein